jgi:hypothetical protein
VSSRPDLLSLLSPDGGTPEYYFELTLSGPGREQTAEVRVFIKTHHAAGLFRGTAHVIESRERGNVIYVRCRLIVKPVPDKAFAGHRLLDGAELHIDGEFPFNPKTYDRLNTEMQALMKWFDEVYSLKSGH